MSVCLFVCLVVSNKRQNGWTDRAQIFCGASRDSREGLWIIKISNICPYQNSIVIKFLKILKIREIFCENPRIIFVLFYDVHKENMFTINLGDGREAPYKASNHKNSDKLYSNEGIEHKIKWNWVFATNFDFLIPIAFYSNVVN